MRVKGGQIEVNMRVTASPGLTSSTPIEDIMGGAGKKSEPPKKHDDKSKKPFPGPVEDDDVEDGDFATPKRDRNGTDDEPL